ncbi:hypothetical protein PPTG_22322 [Phytophthora nicotianae INRA-310]|uniref:Uncharacterized protein n=1 Tax=Phytophthora nicotianae (strain INRA-310) TaxID=761204 RepID=W2QJJ6_PHYN3|nr:hypothetical protein PPTG_22322 [Phytophthora nicotianae INRA-310]ETN13293.1 hypothetical protein PPTG_22322 [Phytophthora nicotianae INRA-310]
MWSKLLRTQHDFGTRYCSVGEVACLWNSVDMLVWKNWRVKQGESRLNRWLYYESLGSSTETHSFFTRPLVEVA